MRQTLHRIIFGAKLVPMSKAPNLPLKVQEHLKSIFKLESLRPLQAEVIRHVLAGESALLVLPTGGGKSLTYQLPATLVDGLVLVLSPLKALMKDQVDRLRALGVRAGFINSSISKAEREKRQADLAAGKYQILYVTPERFRKPEFLKSLEGIKVSLLVVDEAHCISTWGHDFRPEYAKVGEIRERLGNPPTLAATATATAEVEKEILSILKIDSQNVFRASISRPNIALSVEDVFGLEAKCEKVLEIVESTEGPVIVYFSLIQTLHDFGRLLRKKKYDFTVYHGDLPARERQKAQESFLNADTGLLLATPAFGLGIDKPNIRAVVHAELPGSLEAYFQEVGRGGRDGKPSLGLLLYDQEDVSIQMEFIKWSNPDEEFLKQSLRLIKENENRFRQEGADFLREQLNFYNKRDFRAETALNLFESWGVLEDGTISPEAELPEEVLSRREPRVKRLHEKLLQLVRYVRSDRCRMQLIHDYFSDPLPEPCGHCDNCKAVARG